MVRASVWCLLPKRHIQYRMAPYHHARSWLTQTEERSNIASLQHLSVPWRLAIQVLTQPISAQLRELTKITAQGGCRPKASTLEWYRAERSCINANSWNRSWTGPELDPCLATCWNGGTAMWSMPSWKCLSLLTLRAKTTFTQGPRKDRQVWCSDWITAQVN